MSKEALTKTDAEREEYWGSGEWEEIESEFPSDIGGAAVVSFEADELDILFAACKISGEESLQFIKRAALERAAELIEKQPATPAASS